ncbi:hypothetical protein GCM10025734_42790 [Kitasatospora paranensis]
MLTPIACSIFGIAGSSNGGFMFKRKLARLAVLGGATLMAVGGGLASAEASTSASYIGYGYSTSGSGVWCVQHALNYARGRR